MLGTKDDCRARETEGGARKGCRSDGRYVFRKGTIQLNDVNRDMREYQERPMCVKLVEKTRDVEDVDSQEAGLVTGMVMALR